MSETPQMKDEGWMPFLDPLREQSSRPCDHNMIQIQRKEWDEPLTISWREIHPAMNAEGLMWRPADIDA